MWALIENGVIQRTVSGDMGIIIGDTQHSAQIFGSSWTDEERKTIGLLPIRFDEVKNPDFWEETGVNYSLGNDFVNGKRQYRPRDLDDAKAHIIAQVKAEARRLINAVMKDFQQRNSVAELALMLIANGTDLAAWPKDDRAALDGSTADWVYIKAIRAESSKREAEITEIGDVASLEVYDWRTGWPLPA